MHHWICVYDLPVTNETVGWKPTNSEWSHTELQICSDSLERCQCKVWSRLKVCLSQWLKSSVWMTLFFAFQSHSEHLHKKHTPTLTWTQMNKMYHVYSHTQMWMNKYTADVVLCVWGVHVSQKHCTLIHINQWDEISEFVRIGSMTTLDAYTCIIVLLSTPNRTHIPAYIKLTYLCSIKINTQWGLKPWNH